ncbi:MAG: mechanosensitive ion channel [Xanthomonadales bacterium]|nr:mechanosensitive ion channel [Gammaproteobacteria bacterium]MBT8050781.1 mechanosensitive ion channel [Gammaproteobacteria bacterium]NNJ79942.1 mechanosensitive ion channel [Xanthomonadales bacterium]NNL05758.1 mechanosensitive ion channel [Xanthomonadales bacterium]
MELISDWLSQTVLFLPFLATLAGVVLILSFLNRHFNRRWKDNPELQFRYQLMMLALTLAGGLAILITLPINDTLRGQLLSLIGILLSAAIALSATTFIGNILAGIMLKVVRSARPGDFITIGDLTGRVTEMDLLHTQVQTEFRDLVTVPNLFMVTQPLHVVRASGTIIHAEISLGYDVHHERASDVLREAAEDSGLKDAFVQVRELGDFSISYRVAGLLEDVQSLITARSKLRRAVLDGLHSAGIEIVSPTFMNTRALGDDRRFLPERYRRNGADRANEKRAEDIAFDVAEEAASIEELRASLAKVEDELKSLSEDKPDDLEEKRKQLEANKNRLDANIKAAEARLAKDEGKA